MNKMSLALQSNGSAMQTLDQMSRSMQRLTLREIEQVRKRGIIVSSHEEERAKLTQNAMINAASLGMLEEQLTQLAPLAANTLQALATAYGIGAAKVIMQW